MEFAEQSGWVVIKLTMNGPMGRRGWPDRLFLRKRRAFFIEFKRPGADVTPLQHEKGMLLTRQGFRVYVVDDVLVGRRIVATESEND